MIHTYDFEDGSDRLTFFSDHQFGVDGIWYDERGPWARSIFDLLPEHACDAQGIPTAHPSMCTFDVGTSDDDRDMACVLDELPAEGVMGSAEAFRWRAGDPVYAGGVR